MHIKYLGFSGLMTLVLMFGWFGTANAETVVFQSDLARTISASPSQDVTLLQAFLSTQGFYTGNINGSYLTQTYQAVVKFQNSHSIKPANGVFGGETRETANEIIASNPSLSDEILRRAGLSSQGSTGVTSTTSVSPVTTLIAPNPVTPVTTQVQVATVVSSTSMANNNLIYNGDLDEAVGSTPNKWYTGRWGTNTAVFTYPSSGQSGDGAKVAVTAYTSGDAKWYFADVNVTPGAIYTLSHYYKSNVVTNVTIRWTKTDGTQTYQSLGNPAIANSWILRTNTITIPSGVKSMTIFHVVKSVGTLEIDNFTLVSGNSGSSGTSYPTPYATPYPTPAPAPIPVNATVSAWSAWTAVSGWSVCTNGSQSRTEERTRTVTSPAQNGGTTPSLKELRTVTQTCATTPSSTVPTIPTTPNTPSSSGTLNFPKKEWGAYTGWQETTMDSLESLVGQKAKYRAVFVHWGNEKAFPMYLKSYVKDRGKTLVIFWEATNYNNTSVNQPAYGYDAILNGNFDSYITQFAQDAKNYGGEVILIPFSEMNGNWFPWSITQNGNSPQKHIDAWRKIRNMFKDVPNVKFGWAPNHESVPDTTSNQFENFYPGDAYVDYVGLDGFNFNSPWMTFDQVFKEGLTKMKAYNKPVFIFSFASAQGTQKSAWITDALTVQMAKYPEIKGWIWFNENKERDWRINSDSNSLNAFKSALPLTLPL